MLSGMEGSPVKKTLFLVVISSLAVLMLLPVSASVNTTAGKLQPHGATLNADGSPMPPYPPQAIAASPVVIADGSPMPPYPPQRKTATSVVVADGSPMPPYPPQAQIVSPVLSADGSPMPPYPPQLNAATTNA
jgi:hypothetical protein